MTGRGFQVVTAGLVFLLALAACGSTLNEGSSDPGQSATSEGYSVARLGTGDSFFVSRADGASEVTLGSPGLAVCQVAGIGCDDPKVGQRVVQIPIRISNSGSSTVGWSANDFVVEFPHGTRMATGDGVADAYKAGDALGDQPQAVPPGETHEGVLVFEAPAGPFRVLILSHPEDGEPLAAWRLTDPPFTELQFGEPHFVSRGGGTSVVTLGMPTPARCQWPGLGCDDPEVGQRVVRVPIRIRNPGSTTVQWSAEYFALEFPDGTTVTWWDGVVVDYEPQDALNDEMLELAPGDTHDGVLVFEAPDGPFRVLMLPTLGGRRPSAAWSFADPKQAKALAEFPLHEVNFGDTVTMTLEEGTSEVTLGRPTPARCQEPEDGCDDPEVGQRFVQIPIRITGSRGSPVVWSAGSFVLEFPDGTMTTTDDEALVDYEPFPSLADAPELVGPGDTYKSVLVFEAPEGPFRVLVLTNPYSGDPYAAWN